MSYQEVLIKSSIMSAEQMSRIIQKNIVGSLFIDSANTVATLRNDFSSDKIIMFGKQMDKKPLTFKAGDQFLVVCGEREAVWNAKYMLPLPLWPSIKVYPIERIMLSEVNKDKEYGDVFKDSKIEVAKHNRQSVLKKLHQNQDEIKNDQEDVEKEQQIIGKLNRKIER